MISVFSFYQPKLTIFCSRCLHKSLPAHLANMILQEQSDQKCIFLKIKNLLTKMALYMDRQLPLLHELFWTEMAVEFLRKYVEFFFATINLKPLCLDAVSHGYLGHRAYETCIMFNSQTILHTRVHEILVFHMNHLLSQPSLHLYGFSPVCKVR